MNQTRPSIRQLEYAVALAEARHFGRAARACGVTQPALSTQIQDLEALLGVQLFERRPRQSILTAVGERVIARARTALRQLDDLLDAAQEARAPLSGPLRLGVIPTVAPYLLPHWLPALRRAHPGARVFLHEDRTARLLDTLREGALDVLLLALPVHGEDLETLALLEEPFLLAAPAGHRLAAAGGRRRLRQEDLREENVLLLEDGHCLRDQALEVCAFAGAVEADALRATSLPTLIQMVAGGLGVTLLPASAEAALVGGSEEIAVRRFAPPAPGRRIGLAWRRTSARGAELRLLGDLIAAHAPPGLRPV